MGKIIDFLLAKQSTRSVQREYYPDKSESKKSIIEYKMLAEEIYKLRNAIHTLQQNEDSQYEGLLWANNAFVEHGITLALKNSFVTVMQNECTIAQLKNVEYIKNQLQKFLSDKIKIYIQKPQKTKQRLITIVGTSGIGKTSAMYKLFAHFEQHNSKNTSIRIASLDNQTPGTKEYLEKINAYTGIQGELFFDHEEFYSYARKGNRPEILIVDTAGNNPNRNIELFRVSQSLAVLLEKSEVFLVLPANISTSDVYLILEEFTLLRYDAVIISKMDEASTPCKVLSACMEKSVPIAYISEGKELLGDFIQAELDTVLRYFKFFNLA